MTEQLVSCLRYEEGIEFTTRIPDELLAEKALLFLREKEAVARLIEQARLARPHDFF